jgi:PIN domain nuclease of toxin-antitoxin system
LEPGLILLDTHALIWMKVESKRLSKKATAAILEARRNSALAIASISLMETAWQVNSGRIKVSVLLDEFMRDCATSLVVLPITAEIAIQAVRMPNSFPKDPQDRLIGATALVENLPLITADKQIRGSGVVETIW